MLRKTGSFVLLFAFLTLLLTSPQIIGFSDWQRQILEWNYLGTMWNYILFFVLVIGIKRSDAAQYGLRTGAWGRHKTWYILWLVVLVGLTQAMDAAGTGAIGFHLPSISTILFQLLFIAWGEELMWRGYVQEEYGMLASAAGFGLMHAVPFLWGEYTLMYAVQFFIFTGLVGLLLSWVKKKTGSLYATSAMHGIYNLINEIIG